MFKVVHEAKSVQSLKLQWDVRCSIKLEVTWALLENDIQTHNSMTVKVIHIHM